MAISRVKTWTTNEDLTSSDLNSEFNQVMNNAANTGSAETISARYTFSAGVILDELVATNAAGAGNIKISEFRWDPASGTAADGDGMYIDWVADDAGGTETIMARTGVELTDTDATGEDSEFEIHTMIAATLTKVASFGSAGTTFNTAVTVGVDDTGKDVKFFGATSGQYMLWDESADELVLAGDSKLSFHDAAGGENIVASADGHLEINAGTTLDITATTIDLNGAVAMNGATTGGTNITISGELDAATLDISGNADIDGTLEADAYTVDGTALNEYIADTVGAMVTSNTETNIAVTYQDGDNTLDFAISSIDGTAIGASTPSTGAFTSLSATTDVSVGDDLLFTSSGAVINFNSSDVTLTHASNKLTMDGGDLHMANGNGIVIGYDAQATTPATGELQVWGTGTADSTVVFGHNSTTDSSKFRLAFVKGANATIGNASTVVADGEYLGAIAAYGSDTSDFASMAAEILFEVDGTPGSNDMPGRISFWTTADSGTSSTRRMTIKADGNVGIGTSTPDSLVHIYAASSGQTAHANADDLHLEGSSQVGMTISSSNTGDGNIFFADDGSVNPGSINYDHNTDNMTISAADDLILAADAVGIGTSSPDRLLTVKGALGLETTDSTNDWVVYAHTDDTLRFNYNGSGNDEIVVDTSGNVGIGTASPASTLDVRGAVSVQGPYDGTARLIFEKTSGDGNQWEIYPHTSGLAFYNRDDNKYGLWLGDDQKAAIGHETYPDATLTLNQGADDGVIFTCKSSDISHGITSGGVATVEADDYLSICKASYTLGGAVIQALAEDDSGNQTLRLYAIGGTANTTKTTGGVGLVNVDVLEHNGSNSQADVTADGNVFSVRARVSGGLAARMIVDEDGDLYSVTSAQTFDDHDDVGLISAYDMTTAPDQVIRTDYEDFAKYNEDDLIKAGVLGDKVSEGGMTNVTQLQRLHNGAIRQLGRMLTETRMELAEARKEIKQLAA